MGPSETEIRELVRLHNAAVRSAHEKRLADEGRALRDIGMSPDDLARFQSRIAAIGARFARVVARNRTLARRAARLVR